MGFLDLKCPSYFMTLYSKVADVENIKAFCAFLWQSKGFCAEGARKIQDIAGREIPRGPYRSLIYLVYNLQLSPHRPSIHPARLVQLSKAS